LGPTGDHPGPRPALLRAGGPGRPVGRSGPGAPPTRLTGSLALSGSLAMDQEALTLYPSRWPGLIALAASVLIVTAGLAMALAWGWQSGYLLAAFGGLGAIGAAIWLLPSRAFLHLTPEALIYCSGFRGRRLSWEEVARFGV